MLTLEVGNEKARLRLAIGGDGDRLVERGILLESICDVSAGRGPRGGYCDADSLPPCLPRR